jgi:PAS domain S-box-containing protein
MHTQRPKFLIVEDEAAHVEAIRRAYEDAGVEAEIQSVGTLREFRAHVQASPPALALIDLNLPDGRAVEVLTQPPEDAPFPVLVMTAFGNQQIVVEVLKAGALDYVVKSPAAFATMPRTVEQALREWDLLQNHKRAEKALQESEAALQCILGSTADGILAVDNKGKVLKANQQFADLWRIPQAILDSGDDRTLLNSILEQLTAPEAFLEKVQRLYGTDEVDTDTLFFKDGRVFERYSAPLMMKGALAGRVWSFRDVTERKRAGESQARLATAVAQAAETIVITDVKGTMLYANPAFAKVTGYTCEEALGKNPRMLRSGKHGAEFYRQLWATLTAGQVWSGHLINKRKDGTPFEEEATISPVFDSAGAIVNYVAVKRDVTREVALEAQSRQAAKMEAVGQLAGGVAHDFNNQLQVILGYTEAILGNLPPDHALRDDLQEIRKAARHSADLTRQLLAFSRKQMIAPVVLEVSAAISGSLKMLSRLIGENIRLNFTLAQDTGAVFMDPSQWDQILANLAVNARDAIAGTGNLFIEVAPRTLTEADCRDKTDFVTPGDYVVLTFRDDGPGMTPEIQGHIFEPFFTTKSVGKGTGMGLATVYGIVKQNHGAISVQSAPGQGATFSIYLPQATAAAVAATAKMAERSPTGTETILLVEDETSVLSLILRTLARQGYNILPAATPAEALQVCSSHPAPIHLLLTDVIMPKMSGRDLAERIQKLRPGIRVIFMSGYTTDIMEQQGHLPAGLHVMQKPFAGAVLAQRIRAALDAPPSPPPAV